MTDRQKREVSSLERLAHEVGFQMGLNAPARRTRATRRQVQMNPDGSYLLTEETLEVDDYLGDWHG
jgi:hypothetical protein